MTTLLLDTHTVLWFWWDEPQLSAKAKALICDPDNRKLVSMASPWETAIKVSRKKLDVGGRFGGFFNQHMVRTYFEWCKSTSNISICSRTFRFTTLIRSIDYWLPRA